MSQPAELNQNDKPVDLDLVNAAQQWSDTCRREGGVATYFTPVSDEYQKKADGWAERFKKAVEESGYRLPDD